LLNNLKKLNFIVTKRQRKGLIILSVLLLFSIILEMFGLGILIPIISVILDEKIIENNAIVSSIYNYLKINSYVDFVLLSLLTLLLLSIIKAGFALLLSFKQNRFLTNLTSSVGVRLFKNYLFSPYKFHLAKNSSELLKNLQIEVNFFGNFCNSILTLASEIFLLFALMLTLLIIEPFGALILGSSLTFLSLIFFQYTKKKLSYWGVEREKMDNKVSKISLESLSLIKEIKISGKENFFLENFSKSSFIKSRLSSNQLTIAQLPRLYLELISIIGLIAFISIMLFQGKPISSLISTLGVFVAAVFKLIPSMNKIIGNLQQLKYYESSIQLIYNELSFFEPKLIETSSIKIDLNRSIKLQKIIYKHEQSTILNEIDFEILKGERIGIIGKSGSGKSTLVDLIAGIHLPESGDITVDGVSIKNNLKSWQMKIGYVPQNIKLMNASIKENIALGFKTEEIDLDKINEVIIAVQLSKFIEDLPKGLNTYVGDNGSQISVGQKQRIGLARALYSNPSLLVLDEATASLDTQTEIDVMKSIYNLDKQITILIVAHRTSTLSKCNKTYEVLNGKLNLIK